MHPTAQSLLNAQIAFLDQELQGDRLQAHLEVEAKGYCELLQSIAVRDLLPPAELGDPHETNGGQSEEDDRAMDQIREGGAPQTA